MFSALVEGLLNWLSSMVSTFPSFDIGTGNMNTISDSITAICDFIAQVNYIIPLPDIAIIIGLDLTIRFGQLALFCINWVIRRIADFVP